MSDQDIEKCPTCDEPLGCTVEVSDAGPLEWCAVCANPRCRREDISPYEVS